MNLRSWIPAFAGMTTLAFLIPSFVHSDEIPRIPWVMDDSYSGPNQNSFNKLRYEVPILMRQTMINLAVRCGLDFEEGWQCPLTIRFDDNTPMGAENVLAYVQMEQAENGGIRQNLVINLQAYAAESFNFNKVFSHELVHAMLNDSLGVDSMKLPVWFHEGLAVYGANQGEQLKDSYVGQIPHSNISTFVNGLEGSHGALDYLEDYLAFKYIHDVHGVNSLRNFIHEVLRRKGDIAGALDYTCLQDWETFLAQARAFAEEEVAEVTRSLRGERITKPF